MTPLPLPFSASVAPAISSHLSTESWTRVYQEALRFKVMAQCMSLITYSKNTLWLAMWAFDYCKFLRPFCMKDGLKVQQMDEIMCRSVITIISLQSKKGSAEAEGGGQVIDGLGSAFLHCPVYAPNYGSHEEMWVFSLANISSQIILLICSFETIFSRAGLTLGAPLDCRC